MRQTSKYQIKWNPDLEKVSQLMYSTWDKPCMNYDTGLLADHIMRPTADPDLCGGHVDDSGNLVSFEAFIPFNIEYLYQKYKAVFGSFLTVSQNCRGKGLAVEILSELFSKVINQNYEIFLGLCEVDEPSNYTLVKTLNSFGLKYEIIKTFSYLTYINKKTDYSVKSSFNTREYIREDKSEITGIINSPGTQLKLRRIIPDSDIDYIFLDRPHTKSYVYLKDKTIKGLANVLILEVLDQINYRNVYIESIFLEQLSLIEQTQFITDILLYLQPENFKAAFLPNIRYVPLEPFKNIKFRQALRRLNLYMVLLPGSNGLKSIKPVDSFFLDIF